MSSTNPTVYLIKSANDVSVAYTWADVGLSTQRVTQIAYTSAIMGNTATKSFSYTLTNSVYRLDTVSWSVS